MARVALPAKAKTPSTGTRTRLETAGTQASGIEVSLEKTSAVLDAFTIDRDLYYYYDRPEPGLSQGPSPEDYFYKYFRSRTERMVKQLRRMDDQQCYIIPKGGYLAFGDNAPTSNDSRYWGPVPADNLIGPALFTWWPPHQVGILK